MKANGVDFLEVSGEEVVVHCFLRLFHSPALLESMSSNIGFRHGGEEKNNVVEGGCWGGLGMGINDKNRVL